MKNFHAYIVASAPLVFLLFFVPTQLTAAQQPGAAKSVAPAAVQAEPRAAGQTVASPPEVVPALPVPRLIKFSGTLKDPSGQPRTGTVGLTFSIYKDQEGGSTLWMETHNVELNAQGHYSVLLGSRQSEGIPLDLFVAGESRWLGVKVELPGEVEQARVLLVSVPYALKASDADTLGGKPASAYALAQGVDSAGETQSGSGATGTSQTGSANASAIVRTAISGSGMVDQVAKFTPDGMTIGSSAISEVNGNVGVGVSNPQQSLVIAVPPGRTAMNMSNLVDQDMLITVSSPGAADKVSFIGPSTSTNLALGVAGGEKVRITNAGNVGIGVSSPAQRLTIAAPVGGPIINASNLADQDMFITLSAPGAADKHAFFGPGTNTSLTLGVNSTEMIRINNAGNVGINNPAPGTRLDVAGGSIRTDTQLISTVATGTPPLSVNSTTMVPNLNAAMVGGMSPSAFATLGVANNTFSGSLTLGGNLALPNTTSSSIGVLTIGGAPFLHNFGSNNTFVGANAGNMSMGGQQNAAFGTGTLVNNTTGNSNSAFGSLALSANTTGNSNSAFGHSALAGSTTGANNAAFGTSALGSNVTGMFNAAFGAFALFSSTDSDNTAFGFQALSGSTTGAKNVAIGHSALVQLTTGSSNIGVGFTAGLNFTGAESNNIVIGNNGVAGESNTIRIGSTQTATFLVGNVTLPGTLTAGSFTGNGAGLTNITASNAAMLGGMLPSAFATTGVNSFAGNQTITGSVALSGSLALPNTSSATVGMISLGGTPFLQNFGTNNTFVGNSAGNLTLTGANNSAFGASALVKISTGGGNAAFGANALSSNTINGNNSAFGFQALTNNNDPGIAGNAANNSAFGSLALQNNTIGASNSAFGSSALSANTGAGNNSAFGAGALENNAVNGNSAFGFSALNANSTGSSNAAFGFSALSLNSINGGNSAFGAEALRFNNDGSNVNNAENNSAFGSLALRGNTTGAGNSAFGSSALLDNTMGANNSAFGLGALERNTTGGNNAAFGAGALTNLISGNSNIAIGVNSGLLYTGAESNNILIANGGVNGESNTIRIGSTQTATFLAGTIMGNLNGSATNFTGSLAGEVTGTQGTTVVSNAMSADTANAIVRRDSSGNFDTSSIALSGDLALPNTASASVGVLTLGGTPFLHGFGTNNTFVGSFAGNTSASLTGGRNTGVGSAALFNTTTGGDNTAVGFNALSHTTTGGSNSAFGSGALQQNTASDNSAFGFQALIFNTAGANNSAFGANALQNNSANSNSAFGTSALNANTTGFNNSAFGSGALASLTSGDGNIAIGTNAGMSLTAGSGNIYIGNGGIGSESDTIRIGIEGTQTKAFIAGIEGMTTASATGTAVVVDNNGQLGSVLSSRRFKHQIADMGAESDLLMKLRPVAFYYKPEFDETQTRQYGLVAEEVAQIAPQLVIFDKDGQAQTVRYHFVNAMLLNEVQKQRRTIQRQQTEIHDLAVRLAKLEALLDPQR